MFDSLWEEATESDWPEEERRQWYRERPRDDDYYRIQRELLKDGLTRKAKLTQLPPHEEGQPTLWAIGIEGPSPLRLPEASQNPLHVSLAFDDELSDQQKRDLERDWGEERDTTLHFHKFTSGAAGELSLKWEERAAGPRKQLLQSPTPAHQLLVNGGAQTRRLSRQAQLWSGPIGYTQEGEPLTLDLPNRKASIYTSSHFYLEEFPNASEPLSDAPLPHTSLNPAAAFETADEGYDGVPFPRPPREFTRPNFLPDSDDGGTDPGQALRNDGLNPPRPPTLGGRMRESGGDRGGRRGGRGGRGEERVREPDDAGPSRRRRLAGPHAENPQAATGTGPPTQRSAGPANHRTALGSGAPAGEGGAAGGGGGARGGAGHRELRFPAAGGGGSIGRLRHCRGGRERRRRQRRRKAEGCWQHWAREPWLRRAPWARRREAWPWREQGLPWSARRGPLRAGAASHLMGWGAATGGTDSDASRPSMTTDVQTLNGMQESGAVDHYWIQEQRRAQRPEVFRIDTESESEPRNRPLPQIRSRPARRPRPQAQTPFGLNNVPIPVSSDSDRSRISRQSRGDRGPLGTEGSARGFAQPSFEALRQASEPEAA